MDDDDVRKETGVASALSALSALAARTDLPPAKLQSVKRAIISQMQLGLSDKNLGLMMLPSFVDAFPSSLRPSAAGPYYAIDLGGTSLKVVCIELRDDGKLGDVRKQEWAIPDECYDTDNGRLLTWIVECFTAMFARAVKPIIGFCYSFACRQDNLDHGEQILWTKRFKGTGLLGVDVVRALTHEFAKQGIEAVIPALMNDSVASLVGAQFADPRVRASVILGTGTNCSYVEDVRNIKTLPATYRKHGDRMIVNTEWGDCALPAETLGVALEEDAEVDRESANPGHGLFEKLISGLYVGDVARRIIVRIASNTGLLGGRSLTLDRLEGFDGAAVSRAYHDDSDDLGDVGALLAARGTTTTLEERRVVKAVCSMVAVRSARLCAAAMAAVATAAGGDAGDGSPPSVVISVDGSMFTKFDGYRELVSAAIDVLRGATEDHATPTPPIEIILADGSSVSGAAICAAVFTMSP